MLILKKQHNGSYQNHRAEMVRVTGFEPAASCSQSRRATNCATPGYLLCGAGRILRDRRDRGAPDHYNPSATAAQAFINFLLTLKIPAIWAEFVRHYW